MKHGTQLVFIFLFFVLTSIFLIELGLDDGEVFQIVPPDTVDAPEIEDTGLMDSVKAIIDVIGYLFDMLWVFIKLLAFQVPAIPFYIVLFIYYPLNLKVFYIIFSMIRGINS